MGGGAKAKVGTRASAAADEPVLDIAFEKAKGPLLPLVESYYLCRYEAEAIAGVERVDLGQIRFMLRGEGSFLFPDGRKERSRPVMINGPGSAAARYRIEGPFHCFGISLRAVGWRSLIGLPAAEVSDRVLDGAALLGPEALALLEKLRGLTTIAEMVAAAEPFLIARRRPVPPAHLALARAVHEWAAVEGAPIQALFDAVPMSERQVTRLCNDYFGGSPNHLKRKFRAIRAAMRIYQGAQPAEVAASFYDQPHMIRELKHFTGHTPRTLQAGIDPILAITLDNETFHFLANATPEAIDDGG